MSALNLNAAAIEALRGRSMLTTQSYDSEALEALLSVADAFQRFDRAGIRLDLLPNELAYALFFDNSTRTKSAWAGAASRLGMRPVIVDGSSTQVSHGETAEETGAMLGMNAHAMGIRHDLILGEGQSFLSDIKKGIDDYLVATGEQRKVPIVNLQCDVDHPTQSLADLLWLREKFGDLRGRKIAMSWAYSPSYAKPLSVPQGIITLMSRMGVELVLAHPKGYGLLPSQLKIAQENAKISGGSFKISHDMDAAFEGADVVYPKSWGPMTLMKERVGADAAKMVEVEREMLALNAQHRSWICDEHRMALTRDALYMHCLPADIGDEVSPGVMDRFRMDLAQEAQKKLYVIMALLATAKLPQLAEHLQGLAGGL